MVVGLEASKDARLLLNQLSDHAAGPSRHGGMHVIQLQGAYFSCVSVGGRGAAPQFCDRTMSMWACWNI